MSRVPIRTVVTHGEESYHRENTRKPFRRSGLVPFSCQDRTRGKTDIVLEGVPEAYKRGAISMYLDPSITHSIH
jgi:hypothetical protein